MEGGDKMTEADAKFKAIFADVLHEHSYGGFNQVWHDASEEDQDSFIEFFKQMAKKFGYE